MAKKRKSTDQPPAEAATKLERARAREREPKATAPEAEGNAIEFATALPAGGTLKLSGSTKAKRETQQTESRNPRESASAAATAEKRARPVPDSVRERFIQIGNSFYFPDGAEAFTDHGHRVTTRSENAVVIQSMVAIARERAASAVTVAGTELFKKEAWFAARLVGLEVSGYQPSALEQERLVRAIARRREAQQGEEVSLMNTPTNRDEENSSRPRRAPSAAPREPAEGELIVGRLVDHGPAPYQHKPQQAMSYYVRIETERGDREIWGVDLERAFRQSLSTPGIGQEVGVRAIGRDPVTVPATKRDAEGREIGREELRTHRNQWSVESKEFLDRRREMADMFRDAAVGAAEAVKRFPELEGSYLQLQVARAGMEQRIESAGAREQFVGALRAHLAKAIQYGQALEPVRLRARAEQPEKTQDRDYAPTR